MIVNPGKFQAIILYKKNTNHTQETIKIDKKAVKSSVKLLGVLIDAKFQFIYCQLLQICSEAT